MKWLHRDAHFSIDTFKRYIKINRFVSEEVRNRYMKFLSYLMKLYKLKMEPYPDELHEVKQSLIYKNNKMDCGHKNWLLEKVKELDKVK
jgi:hypothetical protein